MQCRICLDDDRAHQMVSPCKCRGSAAFIHADCLEQYITHYPNGICRVCETPFSRSRPIREPILLCFAVGCLFPSIVYSTAPLVIKLGMIIGCGGALAAYWVWNLFDFVFLIQLAGLTFVPLMMGEASGLMPYLGFLAYSTGIYFILYYVPTEYILLIGIIAVFTAYIGMLLVSVLTYDLHAFVLGFTVTGMILRAFARCHPPPWMYAH